MKETQLFSSTQYDCDCIPVELPNTEDCLKSMIFSWLDGINFSDDFKGTCLPIPIKFTGPDDTVDSFAVGRSTNSLTLEKAKELEIGSIIVDDDAMFLKLYEDIWVCICDLPDDEYDDTGTLSYTDQIAEIENYVDVSSDFGLNSLTCYKYGQMCQDINVPPVLKSSFSILKDMYETRIEKLMKEMSIPRIWVEK